METSDDTRWVEHHLHTDPIDDINIVAGPFVENEEDMDDGKGSDSSEDCTNL
jgi:hypothetical protein